jgi:IS4 transposase
MQDIEFYIIVFKRKKKNSREYEKVFWATNIDATADEIIKMYDNRWEIEPLFRTTKQSLKLDGILK